MSLEKFNSFELQMEVLTGCAFKCDGCFVNKNNDYKVTEKLYTVAEEFLEVLDPYAAVLGSTDVFTAANSVQLLSDIRFTELLKRFDRLVVNSTLAKLDPKVLTLMAGLGTELQINVLVPETKYLNDRYLSAIRGRVEEVKQYFPELVLHPQLNLTSELEIPNYEDLNNYYIDLLGQGVDFNLSFARTHSDPKVYQEALRWLKRTAASTRATIDGDMSRQHVDVVSPLDKLERAVIFYENEFYAIPIVYEDLIQIRERYRFDDYQDYNRRYNELINAQYQYASDTEECLECEFLPVCADHRVLAVMQDYDITECVLPKQTIQRVNGWW